MEHTSDLVAQGNLLHETSYPQRSDKMEEVEVDGIKIDFYDKKNKVIHEIKKSDKMEDSHEWQLKYYIYVLKHRGVDGVKGILEYPKLREKKEIVLSLEDEKQIEVIKKEISEIILAVKCPNTIHKKFCSNCAYYDFCYINEEE
jgi:CRISPR-associated exonuclease Cas4